MEHVSSAAALCQRQQLEDADAEGERNQFECGAKADIAKDRQQSKTSFYSLYF